MLTLFVTASAALLAIWVLYPAALAALGALRRDERQTRPDGPPPTVTVLVASRDAADAIADRIADLLAADYGPARLHVVVALDSGARATIDAVRAVVAQRFGPDLVTLVDADPPGGKAAALNAAARHADGELLVFTDTHQRFHPDAIGQLAAFLAEHPSFGAVSGALDLGTHLPGMTRTGPTLAERYWTYEKWVRANEARVHSTVGVTGAIYAMRRALWAPLPVGVILDDVYTPMRLVLAGHRVGFTDAARAVDTRRFGSGQEYRRKVRTLTGVIQLCAWLPDVLVPLRNPIWLQFLFHKLLRLITPYVAIVGGLAAVGLAWSALGPGPVVAVALAGAAAMALPRIGPRLRALVVWAITLQAAIVVATMNGLRRRWNVW